MSEKTMQVLPWSGHYTDLQSLIKEIKEAQIGMYLKFENEINKAFYVPDPDTFEVVLSSSGDKIFIPNAISYHTLFRGQTQDWGKCKSSLYRNEYDDIRIFIERLRLIEFCGIVETHPVVQRFFMKNNYRISKVGLAQHYGIQTEMLDITNDVDISAFFAVCPYDKETDSYKTICDDQVHIGVIYATLTYDYLSHKLDKFLDDKISVIGMQPFMRPGSQKGFSIKLEKEEEFFAMKYTFNYTKQDSDFYFNKFKNGESLWTKDEIASMIKPIIKQTHFSRKTFQKAYEMYRPKGYSRTKLIKALCDYNISIDHKLNPSVYPSDKIQQAVQNWNSTQAKNICKILQRKFWRDNEVIDKDGNKSYTNRHDFRSLEMINDIECLRLLGSHYRQKFLPVKYFDITRFNTNNSSRKDRSFNTDWRYIEPKVELMKSETFLDEKDCLI
ncbi:MAG: FRG domain-containing protein [Clostridiales bacterium]|nr:FRG domain-containing protein [Clostridiales bacterium]